jgi:hypothetical protein
VRITVSVCRKDGRPGYGSEGASCELTVDVAETSVGSCAAPLVDEIRRCYALADQVVTEQLARSAGPAPVEPVRQAEPDRDRRLSQARPPSEPEPERPASRQSGGYDRTHGPDGAARWQQNGRPKSGRELIACSRKREESGESPGLFKRLVRYGESQGFPPRVVDWSREEVDDAIRGVLAEQDDDAPAPARNGYRR